MKYETSFAPYWPGAQWAVPVSVDVRDAYTSPNSYPVDDRSVAYTYAFIGIKRLGAAQFHLMTIKDKTGQPFDGGKTYQLHVPPNAPAKQYWSATVYAYERGVLGFGGLGWVLGTISAMAHPCLVIVTLVFEKPGVRSR